MASLILTREENAYKLDKSREGLVSRDRYDIIVGTMFEGGSMEVVVT
jgi:hypothetical protein